MAVRAPSLLRASAVRSPLRTGSLFSGLLVQWRCTQSMARERRGRFAASIRMNPWPQSHPMGDPCWFILRPRTLWRSFEWTWPAAAAFCSRKSVRQIRPGSSSLTTGRSHPMVSTMPIATVTCWTSYTLWTDCVNGRFAVSFHKDQVSCRILSR
jgi:hypothetical protein